MPNEGTILLRDHVASSWLLFENPLEVIEARTVEEVPSALLRIERAVEIDGLHAAGLIAYEAAPAFDKAMRTLHDNEFPKLWFGLYREPSHVTLPSPQSSAKLGQLSASISEHAYLKAIAQIKERIQAGETYQVNFTFRLRSRLDGDPWEFFIAWMAANHPPPYAAYLDIGRWSVLSASPELFLETDSGILRARPMKGTAPRGSTCSEDIQNSLALAASSKDRAENVMIVDMVRNDLGRVADVGTVSVPRLFDIEKYPTVWQMTSTVEARTFKSLPEIMSALFPAASITGAPKIKAMEIIAGMEDSPRRIYTGCIGYSAPGGKSRFNVAIRTLLVEKETGTAEYGVGGGIVWDSIPAMEFNECRVKAKTLVGPHKPFSLLETILWTASDGYFLLERHLDRLRDSADYFDFTFHGELLRNELDRLAKTFQSSRKVRILLNISGAFHIEDHHFAPDNDIAANRPVAIARHPVDQSDPFLHHKTTRRLIYSEAKADFPNLYDIILFNQKGQLTETCVANLILDIDGELLTPSLGCGLLPGVHRAHLLAQGSIKEAVLTVEHLSRCRQILLVNSLRGILEVHLN